MRDLTDEARRLLSCGHPAHLATLMPDGSPHSVPVWVGLDGDRAWEIIDRMADAYIGMPYAPRTDRVVYAIEPEHVRVVVIG